MNKEVMDAISREARIIIEHAVERKPGYLYFIDEDGNVCEVPFEIIGEEK